MRKIGIVDTTLRDGEQTAGVSFSGEEKVHLAKVLDELGVDIIEAGIPAMGREEINVINKIYEQNLNSDILCWSRMKKEDIDKTIQTGCKNIHMAVPSSRLHIYKKLNMTYDTVIEELRRVINYGRNKGLEISIGAEDACRADFDFLIRLYQTAKDEGAIRIRYADTVGSMDPFTTCERISRIKEYIDLPIDFHGHNDLGMATANAFGSIKGGADYISCSINGLGERAGNTSLEEIAVMLEMKDDYTTNINLKKLLEVSKLVEKYSGRRIPESKPIVGEKVFSHEAGIHVDGLLKDRAIYEQISPELVGRESQIVLGKHSGKKSIVYWMQMNGKEVNEKEVEKLLLDLRKS